MNCRVAFRDEIIEHYAQGTIQLNQAAGESEWRYKQDRAEDPLVTDLDRHKRAMMDTVLRLDDVLQEWDHINQQVLTRDG